MHALRKEFGTGICLRVVHSPRPPSKPVCFVQNAMVIDQGFVVYPSLA